MRVLVSGSSGMIGTALIASLVRDGHEVIRLVRKEAGAGAVLWDPYAGTLDTSKLEKIDAVVHLAGESIANGRWTSKRKRQIMESRSIPTKFLAEQMARLPIPPKVFLSASAIGYYGDRGEEILTEESGPGEGFLAEVCKAWELACDPARSAGIRTINLRIGIVLSKSGGALKEMLTPIKLGVGGKLGDGKQYWSWVTLDDLVAAIRFAIDHEEISGAVNVASPQPVTNAEFTNTLARLLHRPAFFAVPRFALKLLLGEMAEPLLLSSARVSSEKLVKARFSFQSPELEPALRRVLSL